MRPNSVRWGSQLDVQLLDGRETQVAGYLAKYATKSIELAGGSVHRITPGDLDRLALRDHPRRLAETALELHEHNRGLRLARCAHQNGYRGHCLTKSRRYSTTFVALRQAREQWIHERLLAAGEDFPRARNASHATATAASDT